MIGTADWTHLHEVAWAQDLAIAIPFACFGIAAYQIYKNFIYEEESTIDVKRYERPKHELYTRSRHEDNDLL